MTAARTVRAGARMLAILSAAAGEASKKMIGRKSRIAIVIGESTSGGSPGERRLTTEAQWRAQVFTRGSRPCCVSLLVFKPRAIDERASPSVRPDAYATLQ